MCLHDAPFLGELAQDRRLQLSRGYGAGAIGQGFYGTIVRDTDDAGAREFIPSCNLSPINVGGNRNLLGKRLAPDLAAFFWPRHGEMDDRLKPADKGLVDMGSLVGGQDHKAVVALDSLQQVGHFLVGVFIMRITDVRSLTEQGIGFVKEQDPVFVLGFIEEPRQILLRLADIFRHHARQVDPEHIFAGLFAEQRRRQGLACARRAIEQGTVPRFDHSLHAPALEQRLVVRDPMFDLVDLAKGVRMEHEVVPRHVRFDVLGWKLDAEPGLADSAERQLFDDLRIQDQSAAHDWLPFRNRREPENTFFREPMVAVEQALHFEPLVEIVAGEDELGGFAGGKDAAMVRAFYPAELGKVAAFWEMLDDDPREEIGLDVRSYDKHQHGEFFIAWLLMFHQSSQPGVLAVELERHYLETIGLPEAKPKTVGHYLFEPIDCRLKICRIPLTGISFHVMSPQGFYRYPN